MTGKESLRAPGARTISFDISEVALRDILTTGCAGAERLWLFAYSPTFGLEPREGGRVVTLHLRQPSKTDRTFNVQAIATVITVESIAKALGVMAVTPRDRFNAHLANYFTRIIPLCTAEGCGADYSACDTALQVAVFGFVAYG